MFSGVVEPSLGYYGALEYDNTGEINLGLAREGVFCVVLCRGVAVRRVWGMGYGVVTGGFSCAAQW